jgi:hypothetical protein
VTIPGFYTPPPPPESGLELEPESEAGGQAGLPSDVPTYLVEIDYAGNWIARPVAPLTPRPAPQSEPPRPQDPEAEVEPEPPPPPARDRPAWQRLVPPPGPLIYPPARERPAQQRCVPPPGPRYAEGPPPLGPSPATFEFDPLSPYFTRDLTRKTARIMAGIDRSMRPGGIATPEGLLAAVRAGMQHLAAHQGDIRAALASVKAGGASGDGVEPLPSYQEPRTAGPTSDKVSISPARPIAVPEVNQANLVRGTTDEVGGRPVTLTAWDSETAKSVGDPKPSKPSPLLELAASTMNPRYAARMLGYDFNTFGDMLHAFKDFYRLRPDNNVRFYDTGDVLFQGQYVGNIHGFGP